MMKKESYLENEYCEYWVDDGIIYEMFKSTFDVLTLEIAKKITSDRLKISNGKVMPLYVELGDASRMKREANKYLSSGDSMKFLSATGIVVRNPLQWSGASIYINFIKPKIPTRFFMSRESAIFWLMNHRVQHLN